MNGALGVHWDDFPLLRDRAVSLLTSGPAQTPALAKQIFGMRSGPAGLAASLVHDVLGSDPRFQAGSDNWILRDEGNGYGSVLLDQMDFVVVDVEATGGSPARGDRLTEVAAFRVRDGAVVGSFESLINPQRPIPPSVTRLTDITDEMVAEAPTFGEVAEPLRGVLEGAVFVAHNVSFDWRFLRAEYRRCRGGRLNGERLCTLRLARRLLPELPRRSLHVLADYYDIGGEVWHRAGPDARVTAELLIRFLKRLAEEGVEDWNRLQEFLQAKRKRKEAQEDGCEKKAN